MKLHDPDCRTGDFLIVTIEPSAIPQAVMTWPDYEGAEAYAKGHAQERCGRRIFIAQISGEIRSKASVFEVHPK